MNPTMSYKGYTGTIEFSKADVVLFGRVLGLRRVHISYEGKSFDELKIDFHNAVDSYLEFCREDGMPAQKPRKSAAKRTALPASPPPSRARKRREKVGA